MTALVLLGAAGTLFAASTSSTQPILQLHRNWALQSSCQVKASGEKVSSSGFSTDGWHYAEVPTTVVAALVADKTYPDPYFGKNMKSLPGMNYPSTDFFANQEMPEGSPFRCSWWFRTEFAVPTEMQGKMTSLHFDAINYRANVWLNGEKIAGAQDTAGTFRVFDFDVTRRLKASGPNVLAVEIFAAQKNDLAITWVDWNPTPADKDMGLWKDVYLTSSGAVALDHPFATSKLDSEYKTAGLTLSADLRNTTDHAAAATLNAEVENIHVSQKVDLAAGESKTVSFSPEQFPQLKLQHPRLWWPYQMGTPEMYTAKLSVEVGISMSDSAEVNFGVREVTSQITDKGSRLFSVNGRKVLIRGAAWAPDMLLRWSPREAQAALDYVKHMNLNAIRLEGRMERDEFFDMADKMGLLIMPGWTCCDMWEHWPDWKAEHMKIAGASLHDQITRLRNHPSVFVWLYGSDGPPPANVENMYLGILKERRWPNPSVSSASADPTTVTGPSGVKMTGPYDFVPPNYWLTDTQAGGAYGFNTETSPGPVIPPLESLKRFLPADHLWPMDDYWAYHSGGERFTNIDKFTKGLDERYGKAADLNDFLRKSQAANYEAQRAMFEAYGRNKYVATGVIQWMLNNAWPSLIWHLYDYYLVPAGGYFGTRKACEPLHVQYSYDDNSVAVVNGEQQAFSGLKVSARIFDINAKEKAAKDATLDAPADSSTRALELPKPDGIGQTYFLKLELRDATGKLLSDNFYWLSAKVDVLDWANKLDTVYTPQSAFADMTGLNSLKEVKVTASAHASQDGNNEVVSVSLQNPSSSLAFMVRVRAVDPKSGQDVVPIFWDDNYVSLLPGEKREITAHYNSAEATGKTNLMMDGWNIASASIPVQ
ncbi:MAG TPA: beta galactosidase jelly roll domain-containing protein [Terriglobales bacterium]|nr:beta galactosidase jelly roll domain-containing protein [Terriglobales bacterium]